MPETLALRRMGHQTAGFFGSGSFCGKIVGQLLLVFGRSDGVGRLSQCAVGAESLFLQVVHCILPWQSSALW